MKTTVTESMFVHAFNDMGRGEQFSYEARRMLFDYLEELESDACGEIELDVIAICCEYSEDTFEQVADSYNIDISECADDDEIEEIVTEWLNENTSVVGTTSDGQVVYCSDF